MSDSNLESKIEDYISASMSAEEKKDFESQINKNAELRERVKFELEIKKAFQNEADEDLRNRIKEVQDKSIINNEQTKIITMKNSSSLAKRIMGIAASLLLIAGAVWVFNIGQSTGQQDQMSFLEKYINSKDTYLENTIEDWSIRGGNDSGEEDEKAKMIKKVFKIIENQNYKEAKNLVNAYLEKYPEDNDAKYAKAKILLAEGHYAESLKWYHKLLKVDNRELRNESEYYYGLCLLKTEQGKNEAIEIFRKIGNDKLSDWQKSAKEIVKYLE